MLSVRGSRVIAQHSVTTSVTEKKVSEKDSSKSIDAIAKRSHPTGVKPRRAGDLSFSDGRGVSPSDSVSLLLLQAAVLHRDRKVPA